MASFKVWDAEDGSDEPENNNIVALDAEQAAEIYTEMHWGDNDNPNETVVLVHEHGQPIRRFVVTTEPSIDFHAEEEEATTASEEPGK